MHRDPKLPLAPLDPKDTGSLGDVQTWNHPRSQGLDLEIRGWIIGKGEAAAGRNRRTIVEIALTTKGRLITTRRSESRDADGWELHEATGQFHETPERAYAWLLEDGHGKLGPASRAAWVAACRTFAPMNGMEVERVD